VNTHSNTFSRNSIHDNAGLGIDIGLLNEDIDAPEIISVGLEEMSGEVCRTCTVELFLAAPDPTEYGEGMTFIGQGIGDASRRFNVTLDAPIEDCDWVTATATDASGNTSEFALNRTAGLCMTFAAPPLYEPYLTVNTTDDLDDGACTEAHCSLREAIQYANTHFGQDTITFDIPGSPPYMIGLEAELPALSYDRTVVDGMSEPDYAGAPVVWIDGGRFGARVSAGRC
jgi:CSLREA domain-containing protein